jgi:hypothetical protein
MGSHYKKDKRPTHNDFFFDLYKLEEISLAILKNEKYIPKRYQFIYADRVFFMVLETVGNANKANAIVPSTLDAYKQRLKFQRGSLASCQALIGQIEFIEKKWDLTNDKAFVEWLDVANTCKNRIYRWIISDAKRYKNKPNFEDLVVVGANDNKKIGIAEVP